MTTPILNPRAVTLARGIIQSQLPIPLSMEETRLLAEQVILSDDAITRTASIPDPNDTVTIPDRWTAPLGHLVHLPGVLDDDKAIIYVKEQEYQASWKARGGIGAFMMLARKWDRLEPQVKRYGYDVFDAMVDDQRPDGIRDDIGDLRRYLALVEAQYRWTLATTANAHG